MAANRLQNILNRGSLLLFTGAILAGCSVTKFLPDDKYLHTGSAVEISAPEDAGINELQNDVNDIAAQRTNGRFLGWPIGVYFYYKYHEPDSLKGIFNKFMRGITKRSSRKPIFFDATATESVAAAMEQTATNLGYFKNSASFQTDTNRASQEISVTYALDVEQPYFIKSIRKEISDTAIAAIIEAEERKRRLKPDRRYSLNTLRAERSRLQTEIRERGYFFFTENDLEFLADTSDNDHGVQLLMKLSNDIPRSHMTPQSIDSIVVYDDVGSTKEGTDPDMARRIGELTVICDTCTLTPSALVDMITLEPGSRYNPNNHELTLYRIGSYQTFKNFSLSYESIEGSDSLLRLNAFLTPLLPKRIEGEIGGSFNSGQYFGPEVGLSFIRRNLFRGGELLRLNGDFANAFFLGNSDESRIPTAGSYEVSTSLSVPRLWLPARNEYFSGLRRRSTDMQIGATLETLQLNLNRFRDDIERLELDELIEQLQEDSTATPRVALLQLVAQFGYTWQRGKATTHTFDPLSFQLQRPATSSDQLLVLSRSIGLAQGRENLGRLDRMFLYYPGYRYTYDSRLNRIRGHNLYFSQYFSYNLNSAFSNDDDPSTPERERSRFPQVETDFRNYFNLSRNTQIATRIHAGAAWPFSGRAIVPYSRLYSVGGPNSVRGFVPRGIGPGSTVPEDNNLLTFGGYGNILIEGSIELRQKVGSLVELAIFADAGNVWTYRTSNVRLESDFSIKRFMDELGTNVGVGIRFDFDFLIFRIDAALPLQLPYTVPTGEKADDNLRFVFGFGHPF